MLSYHDVVLYERDVATLQGSRWLNDQIVAFYYEYLAHEVATASEIAFLSGAQAFLVMYGDPNDVVSCLVKPLGLNDKALIFMPVNDNPDVEMAEGGMHWSLLVWDGKHRVFVHLDSCGRMNRKPAQKLATKTYAVMGMNGDMKLLEPTVPQQSNAYDCALYVLKFSQILSTQRTEWSPECLDILKSVTQRGITSFREELLDLIEDKRKTNGE